MLKNIMTQFQNLKSIFLPRLWLVLEHLFASMLVVCLLMLMILFHLFSVVIWLLVTMLHKGLELVLTQVGLGASIPELEAARFNTQELSRFSKSLRQQLSAVLKMVFVEAPLRFISQFGIKKLKTFWSSKTTKERKTTEYGN